MRWGQRYRIDRKHSTGESSVYKIKWVPEEGNEVKDIKFEKADRGYDLVLPLIISGLYGLKPEENE